MASDLNHILADPEVAEQILAHINSPEQREQLEKAGIDLGGLEPAVEEIAEGKESTLPPAYEAIVRKVGRPVLLIQDDAIEEPTFALWQDRLTDCARANLERVIPSVGRIELRGHPTHSWVGTGWIVASNVIVTNRHVANQFGYRDGDSFSFRRDPIGKSMRAWIDFYEEYERPHESEFAIREVLHIEGEGGPDMAFLRLAPRDADDRRLPDPIPLASGEARVDQVIGAIGYAGWDGVRNERDVMDDIFGGVYEVKRLHPGEIMDVREDYLNHDCSTLGGNSGSAVLDFATGDAVALHFAGRYEDTNYAVKAEAVSSALEALDLADGA